jgi:2,5-diketo-D-gluconate reductase A
MADNAQPAVPFRGGGAIPILGFGTWQMNGRQAYEAVAAALEIGYRHLDTATVYENEEEVGRALRDSGLAREDVFVTTKLPPDNAGRERATLETSLRRLGTDHVDLWLIHWPPSRGAAVEIWRQLLQLAEEGLAIAVGVSNFDADEVDELIDATGVAPAVNQVRWSPFVHGPERLAHSRDRGVVLEGYSPFKASRLRDPLLGDIARAHGVSPSQVVLRWHVEHDIVVIPKSSHRERITSNFDIFGFSLGADEVAALDRLSKRA